MSLFSSVILYLIIFLVYATVADEIRRALFQHRIGTISDRYSSLVLGQAVKLMAADVRPAGVVS